MSTRTSVVAGRHVLLRLGRALVWLIAVLTWPAPLLAERIAVVQPDGNDPLLIEVFNRLRGELRMHGFETVFSSEIASPSLAEFRRLSELSQADAVVAIERLEGESACHVWFVDRELARDRVMSIAVPETEEAPTLLALRTVEMLRSGLRERQLPTPNPRTPARARSGATGARERSSTPADSAAGVGRLNVQLSGGLAWVIEEQPATVIFMPSIGYRITEHLELATKFMLQWKESRIDGSRAWGEVRTDFAMLEARWLPTMLIPHLGIVPSLGLGAARVSALGAARPDAPIEGQPASAWTMTVAAGLGAWIHLNSRWRFGVTGDAGVFVPKPVVRLDDVNLTMGRPWFDVSLGAAYAIF